MFDLSFLLTGLILLISPIFVLIIHYLSRKVKTIETRIREKLSNLTSYLNQALFGIEIVKVFAMENNEIEKFTEENKKYLKEDKKNIQYINLTKPLVDFVGGLGVLFLLGFGGYLVINNKISSSQLTALIVALMTMSLPIKNFSETLIHIRKTSVSLERIFALIDEKREENANEGILISQRLKGGVSFKDVSFSYGDEPVLENIDITIEPGQVAAFVGYSGAGKTTLVNLIPRLFTPTLGKIFIDDYDITGLSLNSLRKQISVVTQQNIVFAGTVKENILYGNPDASMEDIIRASDISYCTEFIDRMPNGYDTYIGDRGVKLSGGQCQRLTLARAIVRNPAILILDEATSSLDSESEKLIQNALLKIIKNQTTFIISHRLSTVFNADIIFVMDKGRIVDKGTHSELLAQTGIYNKLYELQFNL
jgi:subfamily B ATP-binding cassette protein MsbA